MTPQFVILQGDKFFAEIFKMRNMSYQNISIGFCKNKVNCWGDCMFLQAKGTSEFAFLTEVSNIHI